MSEAPPILTRWTGESFVPANAPMRERCAKHFEAGETYRIEFKDERSGASHRHFFASVNEAWKNLPDALAHQFPTPDELRGYALIAAGFEDHFDLVGDVRAVAQALAREFQRQRRYAIVVSRGNVHRLFVAKSQSARSMDRQTFQASKDAVLRYVADLIGLTPQQLTAMAAQVEQHRNHARNAPDLTAGEPAGIEHRHADQRQIEHQRPAALPAPTESPATVAPNAGDQPPPASPGASTVLPTTLDGVDPEETEKRRGGEPLPKTYNEYLTYLKIWLGFTAVKRIKERYEREQKELWPTLYPALTPFQEKYFDSMVAAALRTKEHA